MTEVVNGAGNWILTHELCEACGCPTWDAFPAGVVRARFTCQRCGHKHEPHKHEPHKKDARAEASA